MWSTPLAGLDIVGTWRYVGEIDEFAQNRFTADAQNYLDLAVGYNLEILGGNTQITVGITNIFDEDPPVHGLFNTAPFSNGNTIPETGIRWAATGSSGLATEWVMGDN